ncbi:MAG: hypothetical protein JW791_03835 [Nanoarchaeota archaeon]|nr:hypothetical protein [Nanoarchaeota archaeon]
MVWTIISGIILLTIVLLAGFSLFFVKKKLEADKYTYEDKYMMQGIGIGLALGIAIGLALGNIALGPALGVALGVAIGQALQQKYGKKIKLTKELRQKKWANYVLLTMALIAGVLVTAAFLYLGA